MTFSPVLHPLLITLIIAPAAMLALGAMRSAALLIWPPRRASLHVGVCTALRLLALAALGAVLLNPVAVRPGQPQLQRRGVALLVDASSSMCVDDETDGRESISRLDRLRRRWLTPDFLTRLAALADAHLTSFADASRALDQRDLDTLAATGHETRLVDRVLDTIRMADDSLGSIVVLTDGRDTTSADASSIIEPARRRGVPVSFVLVGTKAQQPDLNVRLVADHAFVHDGQSTTLRAEIDQIGLAGRHVTAILERNGQVIESTPIILGADLTRLSFNAIPIGPENARSTEGDGSSPAMVALCEFRLRVQPLPAESRTDNNTTYAFVQVTRQHIRIALFENEPYWDTKFLMQTLRNAAEIDLTTIIGLGRRQEITRYVSTSPDDESGQQQDVAPTTLEDLSHYDVVILGRGVERWFPGEQAETLVAYVTEHGGSLVLARGRAFSDATMQGVAAAAALDPIVPVQWAEDTLAGGRLHAARSMTVGDPLSFEGLGDTDLIFSLLPGMIAQTHIEKERAASIIWARTDANDSQGALPAAVATQQVGRGRVLAILVDGLWKWALLPPEQADFDPVFPLFWTRAVRWLAGGGELLPGQSIGLSLSRLNVQPGSSVEITVQTRYVDALQFNPTLTVIDPDGSAHRLEPSAADESATRLAARYTPTDEGLYSVRLDTPGLSPPTLTSRFVVHDPSRERLDLSANHAPMAAVASATGGHMYDANDPEALLNDVQAEAIAAQSEPIVEPVWDRAWVLTLLLSFLAVEWLWRRATGQM